MAVDDVSVEPFPPPAGSGPVSLLIGRQLVDKVVGAKKLVVYEGEERPLPPLNVVMFAETAPGDPVCAIWADPKALVVPHRELTPNAVIRLLGASSMYA